jgi:hypothetical protein
VDRYSLPADWFDATTQVRRFPGVEFWAGASLDLIEV